jgi:AcrR family transcriptional regulator
MKMTKLSNRQILANQKKAQILEAALRVFSAKGVAGASNKDIAREAGIASPGLIYHYFADKDDLFRNVLESFPPPIEMSALAEKMIGIEPEKALRDFARAYLKIGEDPLVCDAIRLFVGEALRRETLGKALGRIVPDRIAALIAKYFDDQMKRGNFKQADSVSLAICFIGPLFANLLTLRLLRSDLIASIDIDQFIETHVSTFLNGAKC